jgi:hypothetical protein
MSKTLIFGALGLAAILGLGAFVIHKSAVKKMPGAGNATSVQEPRTLVGTSGKGSKESSAPPPPPSLTASQNLSTVVDKDRALIGTSVDELRELEKLLPAGSRIATYAVSESQQKAAVTEAVLAGDGHQQTVVVYNTSDPSTNSEQLFLGVLTHEGGQLVLRTSTQLSGNLIYTSINDKQSAPFLTRDVNEDGRPEIIVTSGVGASIGGAIQVYSFDGSSLNQIGSADGHILRLYQKPGSRSAEISAQSRYEEKPRKYSWNGKEFVSQQ